MSKKENPYLFYTEYYLISGAYRVVNILNDILTYSASCSDNIKGYLHNKVVTKKLMLDEIVYNDNNINNNNNKSSVVKNNNDAVVDEDGFVVIRMRRPKLKHDASVVVTDAAVTNSMEANLDNNFDNTLAHSIINNVLNDILYNLDKHYT